MKTWISVIAMAGALSTVLAETGITQKVEIPPPTVFVPVSRGPFYVRSYLGKCLTFGGTRQIDPGETAPPATAVFMDECNPVPSGAVVDPRPQRVIAKQIDPNHHFILEAQGKVVGLARNEVADAVALELQDYIGATGQIWAFDGDSLILAADRRFVAEVQDGRTRKGTRVVLGYRDLDDAEFWAFDAVDGTNTRPTSAFVRVPQEKHLDRALDDATFGTVIEIDPFVAIELNYYPALRIPAGVTVRGDRRGTRLGPLLYVSDLGNYPERTFEVNGSHVRVTGLRLRGPSPTTADKPASAAIFVDDDKFIGTIVDHNELWAWTHAAVAVNLYDDHKHDAEDDTRCAGPSNRPRTVHVGRNFVHHNAKDGAGYGVTLYSNGFANIVGNTFLYNRHAIAADGMRWTGYRAWWNLVLSAAPGYGWTGSEHDFDMHGAEPGSHHTGGIAGADVEIAHNTFLGTNRFNYVIRGVPCELHRFRRNVSRRAEARAIQWFELPNELVTPPYPAPDWLEISKNHFDIENPTRRLGVGDFDGDKRQDLFLATGAAWYYASRGKTEWRYLNARSASLSSLLLGDIDGDGRTDVLSKHGRKWFVAWGGASVPEEINSSDGVVTDFTIGDFSGDGRADLLWATGSEWLVSDGGVGPFMHYAYTFHRMSDLRFGDFNGDGKTDAFAVIDGRWMVRYAGDPRWQWLPVSLTTSFNRIVVADFNGNGRADVATSSFLGDWSWKVSIDGASDWVTLRASDVPLSNMPAIGFFDDTPGADVLDWAGSWVDEVFARGHALDIISGGWMPPQRHSRHSMQ